MSTVPGEDTWTDAGLVRPDEAEPTALSGEGEREHLPGAARPDLDGHAAEEDVVEQAVDAGDDDEDDYPEA